MSIVGRARTIGEIFVHFIRRQRFFLVPLFLVMLVGALVLVLTGGLSYVAPFIYALF